jgi:cytochrome P450
MEGHVTEGPDTDRPGDIVKMDDKELMRDPFHGYSRIREEAPLSRGEAPDVAPFIGPAWLATRYDDVKTVLTDPRFVANRTNLRGVPPNDRLDEAVYRKLETPEEYAQYRLGRMGRADGADHERLREPLAPTLSAAGLERLRPRVEKTSEALLARLPDTADDGVVDLLENFAHPLSVTVLCDLIGIPEKDHERWQAWLFDVKRGEWTLQRRGEAWREMVAFAEELIENRRAQPADDLISAMVRAQRDNTEIITMMLMDHNSHRSAAMLIGNAVVALLTHPDQLTLLRKDPGLIPRAVAELLRFAGVVQVARIRHAAEDVRLGGRLVRKGESVYAVLAAANYDPRAFPDPDRLDITRDPDDNPNAHLAFAGGEHRCLGAELSSLLTEVALAGLVRRFPGLALAIDPDDLDHELRPRHWGLNALPVRL